MTDRPDGWDNLGDEAAYREVMRRLRDYDAMAENLKATQARCGQLLEEFRAERRHSKALEAEVEVLRSMLARHQPDTDFDLSSEHLDESLPPPPRLPSPILMNRADNDDGDGDG